MSGSALQGERQWKFTGPRRAKFEAGKSYKSCDGTLVAIIGAVRRGKYSSRVLAQIDNVWQWYEIGCSGGVEIISAETRHSTFVICAYARQCLRARS